MSQIPELGGQAPPPPAQAREVFGEQLALAQRYADLLASTGIAHGLVGPREAPRLWERHLMNCAALQSLLPQGASIVDIGSGAGLPGLVLAIVRPDLHVALVEPLLRRTQWLTTTIEALELTNVAVHRGRADEVSFQVPFVTARAVASLDKLVRWSFPLLEPGGRLLALKGESAGQELADAEGMLRKFGVAQAELRLLGEVSEPVRVVEIERPAQLPPGFDEGRPAAGRSGKRGRQSRDKAARIRSKSS